MASPPSLLSLLRHSQMPREASVCGGGGSPGSSQQTGLCFGGRLANASCPPTQPLHPEPCPEEEEGLRLQSAGLCRFLQSSTGTRVVAARDIRRAGLAPRGGWQDPPPQTAPRPSLPSGPPLPALHLLRGGGGSLRSGCVSKQEKRCLGSKHLTFATRVCFQALGLEVSSREAKVTSHL